MRRGVIGGNGYQCDVCNTLLKPNEAIKIKSFINIDSTGRCKIIDCIGVCEDCYKEQFPLLYNRKKFRNNKDESK